jgi:Flp pilus assembly protein TadD
MAILFYLKQIVWPVDLLPIYPRWEVDPPKPWQFLAWPVIAAGAYWLWTNRGTPERPGWGRHAILGLGFFLLMVAPVLGFVTISYMRITWVADHFVYLPMIGVIALGGAAAAAWYDGLGERTSRVALAAGAVLLATVSLLAFRYAHAWANEDALWTHTLRTNPDAWQAHNRLGARKFARGDVEAAFHHFTQSTRLRPDLGETHNNLGSALSAKGRIDEAIEQFAEACRLTPKVPIMQLNLANALFQRGRFPEAADRFKQMLAEQPKNPMLLNNYAFCLLRAGDKAGAIAAFRQALAINPTMKEAREGLAIATGEQPAPQPPAQGQPAPPPAPAQPPAETLLPGQSTLGPAPFSSPAGSPSFDPLQLQGK